MAIPLSRALRSSRSHSLAITGAGGKTSLLFQLGNLLTGQVILTTSTHLSQKQTQTVKNHFVVNTLDELNQSIATLRPGINLITGPMEASTDQVRGLSMALLEKLSCFASSREIPLLIEADGARSRMLKAPAEHEPAIPDFVDDVAVVCAISALGKPLTDIYVHRPERFSAISKLEIGQIIDLSAIERVLLHPNGGLKGIPSHSRRIAVINQADNEFLQAQSGQLARNALTCYSQALITSLGTRPAEVLACHENIAGIILAGGQSRRMGTSKAKLLWQGKPFVRKIAETALAAGLNPVVIVLGSDSEGIAPILHDLPVQLVTNPNWEQGQSTSIHAGIGALSPDIGGAIFFLVDQPQIPQTLIAALMERHYQNKSPIIAPLIDGKRGNPVLFDRDTFGDLLKITGDIGGRAIFPKYSLDWLEWLDSELLLDIDTLSDYHNFQELE